MYHDNKIKKIDKNPNPNMPSFLAPPQRTEL